MARLVTRLLGSFEATLDGSPLVGFDSDKVRALLAYLAVEGESPLRREKLAGLLWPDYPESSARTSLRRALSNLRDVIGDRDSNPAFLEITRQTIQFNAASDHETDVAVFLNLATSDLDQLERAIALYRGEFLDGFSIPDSIPFEEWVVATRESLHGQALMTLHHLAGHYEGQGSYDRALACGQRAIVLEPFDEAAYRTVMRILADSGGQAQALAQYGALKDLLADELGVEPSKETTRLAESISTGENRIWIPDVSHLRGYTLKGKLGEGSFGTVYQAFQEAVGREVAIKVVRASYADKPDFIRRFETEAQIVAHLEHPHIVPLYDYWREPGGAYLVMRWLRGGSLQADLERGPWSADAAASLVEQIASALAAAHRKGVVHGDVKPGNILLDEAGNAYLSDFGIARLVGPQVKFERKAPIEIQRSASSMGYLPPELALGSDPAPTADIYSFGVTIFELLTGKALYQGLEGEALLQAQSGEAPPSVIALRPDLPSEVDSVVAKAIARDPDERYADALILAADLLAAITGSAPPPKTLPAEITNPYKGLRAFQEADAGDFYGRENMVTRLLNCLSPSPPVGDVWGGGAYNFLAVVGPSGSGKSSIVKAGLLPALRKGALAGSDRWFITEMTPGDSPFEELEAALLRVAVNPPEKLLGQLIEDNRGLARAVKRALPGGEDAILLLVVDQFEELFTLVDPVEARVFLDALNAAISDTGSRLCVVITLRADFYDRPLMVPDFSELIRERTEAVTPLNADELARAIEEPARKMGLIFEEGLVTRLVAEVYEQTGALPLLQYTLTELFEKQDGGKLTVAAYESMGGVSGALGQRAEELYEVLDEGGKEAVRQVFLRLVTLGEGVEDTRRRVLSGELEALGMEEAPKREDDEEPKATGTRAAVAEVLDLYGRHRLLTFDRDEETRAPTVEVAHEALLREWRRLAEWLEVSRADVRLQRILGNLAGDWVRAGRDPSFLLRGARLKQFEVWAKETNLALTVEERSFLQASLAEQRLREAKERARQEHERALEQRAIQRLRTIVGVLIVASLVGITLTLAVFNQNQVARQNETLAIQNAATATVAQGVAELQAAMAEAESLARATQQAIAESEVDARATQQAIAEFNEARARSLALAASSRLALNAGETELALALALEANQVENPPGQAQAALADAAYAPGTRRLLEGHAINQVYSLSLSPDRSRALSGAIDRSAILWDLQTGLPLRRYGGYRGSVTSIDYLPGGSLALLGVLDGSARLLDLQTGREVRRLLHRPPFVGGVLSPDGRTALWATEDGRLALLDLETRSIIREFGPPAEGDFSHAVTILAFHPSGTQALTGHINGQVSVWDLESGEEIRRFGEEPVAIEDLVVAEDGLQVLTANANGEVDAWDVSTGERLWQYAPPTIEDQVYRLALTPDGKSVIFGAMDGGLRIRDVVTGEEVDRLGGGGSEEGHVGWISALIASPDGRTAASGGTDGELILWDLATGEEIRRFGGQETDAFLSPVLSLDVGQDGTQLLAGHENGALVVWDVESGGQIAAYEGNVWNVERAEFLPNDRMILASTIDGGLNLWDVVGGAFERLFEIPQASWVDASVAGDGRTAVTTAYDLVSGSRVNNVLLWDLESGLVLQRLAGVHEATISTVAMSPDGRLALSGDDNGLIVLWDLVAGAAIRTLGPHGDLILDLGFSPDGSKALSSSTDGGMILWDLATGEVIQDFSIVLNAESSTFSPDGRIVYAGLSSGEIQLWDVETGQELGLFADHTNNITDFVLASDGITGLSGALDRDVRLWDFHNGAEIGALDWPGAQFGVALSPDGTKALTGAGGDLLYWDLETGRVQDRLQGHDTPVFDISFSADGRRAISSAGDPFAEDPTSLILWDLETGQPLQRLEGQGQFYSITITPDGRYGVISSQADGDFPALFLWDLDSGEVLDHFDLGQVKAAIGSVAISPDGKRVLTGRLDLPGLAGEFLVEEWDLETGERLVSMPGHEFSVIDLTYLPDGKRAVSVSWDRSLILWNLERGEIERRISGANDQLFSVAVDPTGRFALTGAGDGALVLWDLETGEAIRSYVGHNGPITHIAFSPDGSSALVSDFGGAVHIWRIHRTVAELVDWVNENRYVRELTCEERSLYQVEPLCPTNSP